MVKSTSRYKPELFFISFFLLTGNLNKLLTIKIPGFSLFEIQPVRFIFFLLCFLILRKILYERGRYRAVTSSKTPVFVLILGVYVVLVLLSLVVNSAAIGAGEAVAEIFDVVVFLVLIVGFREIADKPSYDLIGKSIIIGAVASSIVSLVQLGIDPYFLRIGDNRVAFADFIRSNGIFSTEYFNSYFLIIAVCWTLISVKRDWV